MNNSSFKNILIISIALIGIMIVATIVVVGFNSILGLNTDVNNNDVATAIAAVAFVIGVLWKLLYDRMDLKS